VKTFPLCAFFKDNIEYSGLHSTYSTKVVKNSVGNTKENTSEKVSGDVTEDCSEDISEETHWINVNEQTVMGIVDEKC
jgi:hypothetical protein